MILVMLYVMLYVDDSTLYSMLDQAFDLWHYWELDFQLQSDPQDTVVGTLARSDILISLLGKL